MKKYDLLIIGGGMVGLALALSVRKLTQLTVAIVEANGIDALSDEPELRVSAINAASENLLNNLGVWQTIASERLQAYSHMHVWDKAGIGTLDFDINDFALARGRDNLGHIIENKVIRNALWQQAEQDQGIELITGYPLQNIAMGEHEVFATFTDASQMPVMAKLVVGADGANSWLRQQLDMPIAFRDYDNHAIVATVECEQGHQNTAWQVFLPEGPLAFLPLYKDNLCSIVWSTSPEKAEQISTWSDEDISKALTAAADGKLGRINIVSKHVKFPLTMRLAHKFYQDKAVLVGDAAHTIHPLAGQGVNLGLLDAASLAQVIAENIVQDENSWHSETALKQYNRWRRSDALDMVAAMEAIKQAFTPQVAPIKLLRGLGMSMFNQLSFVKQEMIKQALGYKGDMPELSRLPNE